MPQDEHIAMLQVTIDNLVDKIQSLEEKINGLEDKVAFFDSYITGSVNPPSIQEGDTPEELLV